MFLRPGVCSFSNVDNVINSYVVDDGTGRITDLVSFYSLPSSILGHPQHTDLKAAYMYYTVPGSVSLTQLMNDAMILARDGGYDVFNALDLLQNQVGSSQLHGVHVGLSTHGPFQHLCLVCIQKPVRV